LPHEGRGQAGSTLGRAAAGVKPTVVVLEKTVWRKGKTTVMGWAQRLTGPGETDGQTEEMKRENSRPAAGLKVKLGPNWSWPAKEK
jgi:hypothetical protein